MFNSLYVAILKLQSITVATFSGYTYRIAIFMPPSGFVHGKGIKFLGLFFGYPSGHKHLLRVT